jgi:hypothetical protein
MLVMLPGIVTLVRSSHIAKALSPIILTPLEIVTLLRLVQSPKAPSPMLVSTAAERDAHAFGFCLGV